MKFAIGFLSLIVFVSFLSCEKDSLKNSLTATIDKIEFPDKGGATSFSIGTDADAWKITNTNADWIQLSTESGSTNERMVSIVVNSKTLETRTDSFCITAGNATPIYIKVTQASSEYLYALKANKTDVKLTRSTGSVSMEVTSDAPQWALTSDVDWIQFNPSSGTSGTANVTVLVLQNAGADQRTANITLSAQAAPTTKIPVTQKGDYYPNYNISPIEPDAVGMSSSAVELASKMNLGWNIGNTLEAIGGETAWGNPMVTENLIKLVKQNGFNAIRIPCSWNQYMENRTTAKLKLSWLNRVKQVVEYCVKNDLYVLLNIHYDGGWLERNCTKEKQDENNAMQKAFWQQIATHLRDFDEHLIFAGANEPDVTDAAQMAVLQSYHQTFVDAVRATGGKNSYRVLVVQGPSTDIEKTNNLMNALPKDIIANKMMVEIHYYTPFQYCLMTTDASWGKMFYYWGKDYHSLTDVNRNATWGEESTVDAFFGLMKTKFVDRGIPVIMGEYCVIRRNNLSGDDLDLHLKSRIYYLKYVTQQAKANGLIPFYWDAGNMEENSSALFNRENNTVFDQNALNAVIAGANN